MLSLAPSMRGTQAIGQLRDELLWLEADLWKSLGLSKLRFPGCGGELLVAPALGGTWRGGVGGQAVGWALGAVG